jgi:hypothetical protein
MSGIEVKTEVAEAAGGFQNDPKQAWYIVERNVLFLAKGTH